MSRQNKSSDILANERDNLSVWWWHYAVIMAMIVSNMVLWVPYRDKQRKISNV